MPKHKIGNPLEDAMRRGYIGGDDEESGAERPHSSTPAAPISGTQERQNSRIPEFQNARESASEQGVSGFSQNSRIPERPHSGMQDSQSARVPTFKRSKPPTLPKTNADGWEQQTTYLPPDLRLWLRQFALATNQEISEVIATALHEYRMRQQQRGQ